MHKTRFGYGSKGNEVTVTAQVEGDKVWSPPMKLTLDPKSQDITWETLEL